MLKHLKLHNLGPAPSLELPLSPRLNLITGDNGLIRDWASWQREDGKNFAHLKTVLQVLSPSEQEPLVPGELTRISPDDVRDMPTLRMPYGNDVPVLHASSGMRRILALAYFLVWCWSEHQQAAKLLDESTTNQAVFLVDEVEAQPAVDHAQAKALDGRLRGLLGDTDPFWIRWRFVGENKGGWRDSRAATARTRFGLLLHAS